MNRKAVFFDIDGTLVPFENEIPKSTIDAVRKLRENGHLAVLCTGRTRPLIMPELFEIGFDGIVAGCGSYVEYNGEKVYLENADFDRVTKLFGKLVSEGYIPVYESWQGLYYMPEIMNDSAKPAVDYYTKLLGDKFMPVRDGMEVSKLYVSLYGKTFDKENYAEFDGDFNILQHGDVAVEIIPRKYTKATGMEAFLKAAGVERKDTFAVGDSLNDVEMLEFAQTGIVMGNAFKEVMKFADYITTDINDDGIYNALKHFGLI